MTSTSGTLKRPAQRRGAIYVRLSREGEGTKLNDQIMTCRRLAERHDIDVVKIYEDLDDEDRMSGARNDRPGLLALLDYAREGDVVSVVALDRFGRSTIHVLQTIRDLHAQGIVVRSIRENLDFSTPVGQAVAAIMSALAEMERELSRERAAAAREAARVRGRHVGRPRALTDDQASLARPMRDAGESIPVIPRR